MYRAANWIVRHKVLVVGVACAGFIFFGGEKEEKQPANPWAGGDTNKVFVSTKSNAKKSLTDKAIGAVSGVTKEYTGVDLEELKETNENSWSSATEATKRASE